MQKPIVGVPAMATSACIQSGALEDSNVDPTAELVSMITAQRLPGQRAEPSRPGQMMQTRWSCLRP